MVDKTRVDKYGRHPVAKIPPRQLDAFRMCVEKMTTPIEIYPVPFHLGDKVRVVEGDFVGLEGNVLYYAEGEANLVVCLGTLGCLKLNISSDFVIRI